MSNKPNLQGYIEVPERLRMALTAHPELRITENLPEVRVIDGHTFVEVTVTVWRSPDDPQPTMATCWEPYPGKTPYTRDSEMMNCATSALGRALGYMGFGIDRSIATAGEVRNRQTSREIHPSYQEPDPAPVEGIDRPPSDAQLTIIGKMCEERGIVELPAFKTRREASAWIKSQEARRG